MDTKVLVSALGWFEGNPHKILDKVCKGEIELFITYEEFEELSTVLEYPRFKFTEDQKQGFKRLISNNATFVYPAIRLDVIKDDASDNRILECAVAAQADFIVSGDGHLLDIGSLHGIRIVEPTKFLKIA